MLLLLSPAKSLDYESRVPPALMKRATLAQFLPQSAQLIDLLTKKSVAELRELMDISDALAVLNAERYRAWSMRFTARNSRPAVLAFNGDVYGGLNAASLSAADLRWAQAHLLVLSGLHGLLRPLDLLQPYRLEMGTALANPAGADLYAFWGASVAEHLNDRLASQRSPVIVNLASQEYFRAVRRDAVRARVIDCVFEDWKDDRFRIIGFHAKRARGLMARHAILRRIGTPSGLKSFDAEGYAHVPEASTPERLVFRRRIE